MSPIGKKLGTIALLTVLTALGVAARRPSVAGRHTSAHAASRPDPAGFGIVPVQTGQTIRLNVVCFAHQVGHVPPGPCRGVIMFHDAAGTPIKQDTYDLQPGESTGLGFTLQPISTTDVGRVLIEPCWLPSPGGRAIPSVELFDATGRVVQYVNPAAARMSDFNNGPGPVDPGSIVGFNPQPDPPGFGLVTLTADQSIRINVVCYAHQVGLSPPDPCRGAIMFHDAAGNLLQGGTIDLKPGETASVALIARAPSEVGGIVAIDPCWLPSPGGLAVPSVEVLDANGQTAHLINPAVARMSQFAQ